MSTAADRTPPVSQESVPCAVPVRPTLVADARAPRSDGSVEVGWDPAFRELLGVETDVVAKRLVEQFANAATTKPVRGVETTLETVRAFLVELEPRNVVEAMLATQLVALHEAAVSYLTRARSARESDINQDALVGRTVALTAAFADHAEAWSRLRAQTRPRAPRRAPRRR